MPVRFSTVVMYTVTKSHLARKRFILAYSLQSIIMGIQGRSLESRNHGGLLLTGLFP